MFPHSNIRKYTWTPPDGKTHSQIGHDLINKRRHSNAVDVRYFTGAACDTEYYLTVADIRGRERLSVSKRAAQTFVNKEFI
jgi:hypothetical protein